jgi:hypothetical protein
MIAGLSGFKSFGQPNFYLSLMINIGSISIGTLAISTYSELDYTFINFIYLGCPTAFSYFDSLNVLCHDSYCNPIGYYWFVPLDLCQPCLYDCLNCANGYSCSSCISTNYRAYDPLTQRCLPIPGNFDDGTNNPVASFCISPCLTCTAPLICSSCINNNYFLNPLTLYCYLCSSKLVGCLTCSSETYCTVCVSNSFYLDTTAHKCTKCSTLIVGCLTCGLSAGNLNCFSCDGANGFSLSTNFLSCLCSINSYLNTTTSICYFCSSAMHRCYSCPTDALTCSQC